MSADDDELVRPDLAGEHLRVLQDGLDAAERRARARDERIARLERDRTALRRRLDEARDVAAGRTLGGRVRRALGRRSADRDTRPPAAAATPSTSPPVGGAMQEAPLVAELPVVGRLGPVVRRPPAPARDDVRLGLVADEFTRTNLAWEVPCVDLPAGEAGLSLLRRERPDVLLVESSYRGVDGTWARRIARFGDPHPDLVALVGAARDLGVPTVFWNKEDPVNVDWFLAAAALFDHVLTVDGDLLATYRERLGHDRVGVLPFAAQPAIHRPPDDVADRTGPVLFAGSWFARKHPTRREQLAMLLDPARAHGLQVLDRHGGGDPRFAWPERFRDHVVGSLPYPLAVEATRRFRVAVNVNTVTDSPTMCARRVFELAACATPTVSGPSRAVEELVPPDAIRVVHSADEAAAAYDELLGSATTRARLGEAARAWVLSGHTWADRVATVLARVARDAP